ncbi:MAG: TrmH family RNA methyltransferase [Paludibacteraceae bacterium]|nr:TrmH family RNA methyltransferase [Paludibacteraceae bacterium]
MTSAKKTIADMHRLTPEAFAKANKLPIVVVLDNVRSQHNVGAVFRTADAFCLQGLCLCGITCCPPNAELHKTALGAEQTVDYTYYPDTTDAIHALHQQGYKVYAIELAHNALTPEQAILSYCNLPASVKRGVALVLGHEVFGVADEVMAICDSYIELPQYGTKHSLNVSVTAGIVMYAWARALREQGI